MTTAPVPPAPTPEQYARASRADNPTGEQLLPLPDHTLPQSRFLFVAQPTAVHFQDGELMPILSHLWRKSGVGGVDKHGGLTLARERFTKKGGIVLEEDTPCKAWGVDFPSYMAEPYKTKAGLYWQDVWHRNPRIIGAELVWDIDTEGWKNFLRWIRDNVLKIDPRVKAQALAALTNSIESAAEKEATSLSARRQVKALQKNLPKAAAEK